MNKYAILGTISMVVGLAGVNVSVSDAEQISEVQTLSVQDYPITFVRGSYELVKASHDVKAQLTDSHIESILVQVGFFGNGLKMAKAIAFHESTNRPMALNKSSNCYGLFQINMSGSMGPNRREQYNLKSNHDLYNPLVNAQIAYQMSNGGKNWNAWSTEKVARQSISN